MDLTFPIRWVIPEKDLIDWGQDTALTQNINFSNSIVFLQEQRHGSSNNNLTLDLLHTFLALFVFYSLILFIFFLFCVCGGGRGVYMFLYVHHFKKM